MAEHSPKILASEEKVTTATTMYRVHSFLAYMHNMVEKCNIYHVLHLETFGSVTFCFSNHCTVNTKVS